MKTRIINASTELKNEPSAHKRTMSSVEITEMTGKRKGMPDNDNQKSPNTTKQLFRVGHLRKIRAEIQKTLRFVSF